MKRKETRKSNSHPSYIPASIITGRHKENRIQNVRASYKYRPPATNTEKLNPAKTSVRTGRITVGIIYIIQYSAFAITTILRDTYLSTIMITGDIVSTTVGPSRDCELCAGNTAVSAFPLQSCVQR